MSAAIKITNLTKKYGDFTAVKSIDLSVEEADFFGFIGPNGAGKTTTIKSMLNLLAITSGKIELLGEDISRNNFQEHIGFVPSEANLYENLKVDDQIKYFANFYQYIDKDYLKYLIEIFSLNTKKRISELSLGNKKKVTLICALMHQPKLLIFDEATSGLDPLMQRVLFNELQRLNSKGVTIFFSSHNLEEVQSYCKNLAIIKEGKIVALDNIVKILQKIGVEVKLQSKQKIDKDFFKKMGISNFNETEGIYNFVYNKDVNDLIKSLSKYDLLTLRISDPKLEDVFSDYYKQK